ncbi:hypothetical protein T265_11643 [Opisthorchis viverrini]|uniref:Uncharacterized protein n=1 Tax=Opisthorchis viverrini TaxID=6198 RepID=A0A074Z8T5_OPIVI|nr:hypothetical protein T265_11643 [Opisthorchis viverrini]KER19630.1 hypothetical protein T265_11643 [Opisthorchis viverrini]
MESKGDILAPTNLEENPPAICSKHATKMVSNLRSDQSTKILHSKTDSRVGPPSPEQMIN